MTRLQWPAGCSVPRWQKLRTPDNPPAAATSTSPGSSRRSRTCSSASNTRRRSPTDRQQRSINCCSPKCTCCKNATNRRSRSTTCTCRSARATDFCTNALPPWPTERTVCCSSGKRMRATRKRWLRCVGWMNRHPPTFAPSCTRTWRPPLRCVKQPAQARQHRTMAQAAWDTHCHEQSETRRLLHENTVATLH